MRAIFLNRYFYPDHSATSQMLSDLVFFWPVGGRYDKSIAFKAWGELLGEL